MSRTGDHGEDVEHQLEHAGGEVGEAFVDAVSGLTILTSQHRSKTTWTSGPPRIDRP